MATATATEAKHQPKPQPKHHQQQYQPIQKRVPTFIKVADLHPLSVGFNLMVKVGKIKLIMNRLNLDGTRLKISEADVGDSGSRVILSLRNDQIPLVETGDALILRNAKIDMVGGGFMRVAIDRWGKIEKIDDPELFSDQYDEKMPNLSEVEYELVPETDNRQSRGRGRRGPRGRRRGRY